MHKLIEIEAKEAVAVFGGKDEATAALVSFIAECIGSIAKMIYLANKFRKMFTNPATAMY